VSTEKEVSSMKRMKTSRSASSVSVALIDTVDLAGRDLLALAADRQARRGDRVEARAGLLADRPCEGRRNSPSAPRKVVVAAARCRHRLPSSTNSVEVSSGSGRP
jgi:hypothetical protein